jgi:CRISPR-associated exonuclease Cas4
MYPESELLPISALQHLVYCPRQCGLIHLERLWDENLFTAEGRVNHDRVHGGGHVSRGAVRTELGVALRSLALGLSGQADVVEFHGKGPKLRPFPVEHKRGKSKSHDADRIQLCAQGMCLEEMLGVPAPAGALFYASPRRREEVAFDAGLRAATVEAARALHDMLAEGRTPAPSYTRQKCDRCSLKARCLPERCGKRAPVAAYLKRMLTEEDEA